MHFDKLVIYWFVHSFYETAPIIVFSAPLPSASLEPLWATILLGVVLVGLLVLDVVLVVHAFGVLFRASLRLLAVEPVLALCLSKLVDLQMPISIHLVFLRTKCLPRHLRSQPVAL